MKNEIPAHLRAFLLGGAATENVDTQGVRPRAFLVGSAFSFFLAIGAPYGNMLVKGAYTAQDAATPGAFLVLLFIVGGLNMLFKLGGRGPGGAGADHSGRSHSALPLGFLATIQPRSALAPPDLLHSHARPPAAQCRAGPVRKNRSDPEPFGADSGLRNASGGVYRVHSWFDRNPAAHPNRPVLFRHAFEPVDEFTATPLPSPAAGG